MQHSDHKDAGHLAVTFNPRQQWHLQYATFRSWRSQTCRSPCCNINPVSSLMSVYKHWFIPPNYVYSFSKVIINFVSMSISVLVHSYCEVFCFGSCFVIVAVVMHSFRLLRHSGSHTGFSECAGTIWNWTELNWTKGNVWETEWSV